MMKPNLFAVEREAKPTTLGDALQVLEPHVDFAALAAAADEAAPHSGREHGGRSSFPTEEMLRILLVQQLLNLSDEQMENELLDRLGLQRQRKRVRNRQSPNPAAVMEHA